MAYSEPAPDDPFAGLPQPDWDSLWRTPANPYFKQLYDGAKDQFFRLFTENWEWIVLGLTIFMVLTFGGLFIKKYFGRLAPGELAGGVDDYGRRY